MTRFDWVLVGVAALLLIVAIRSYGKMDDSLSASGSALNQPDSNQQNSVWQAAARFNPTTNRVGFNLSGGYKL